MYGDKRDYRKIEILTKKGEYLASTTWSKDLKQAIDKYARARGLNPALLKAQYSK